jgi:predicted HicB family RNase H-like nuclease
MAMRLPPDLEELARRAAEAEGITLQEWVERALEAYLATLESTESAPELE